MPAACSRRSTRRTARRSRRGPASALTGSFTVLPSSGSVGIPPRHIFPVVALHLTTASGVTFDLTSGGAELRCDDATNECEPYIPVNITGLAAATSGWLRTTGIAIGTRDVDRQLRRAPRVRLRADQRCSSPTASVCTESWRRDSSRSSATSGSSRHGPASTRCGRPSRSRLRPPRNRSTRPARSFPRRTPARTTAGAR